MVLWNSHLTERSSRPLRDRRLLHAELYVSRMRSDGWAVPLESIITVCSRPTPPMGTPYVKPAMRDRVALEP